MDIFRSTPVLFDNPSILKPVCFFLSLFSGALDAFLAHIPPLQTLSYYITYYITLELFAFWFLLALCTWLLWLKGVLTRFIQIVQQYLSNGFKGLFSSTRYLWLRFSYWRSQTTRSLYRYISNWGMGFRRPPFRLVWFDRRQDGWLGFMRSCAIGETVLWGWSKIKGCPEILGGPNKSNEKEPRLPSDSKALYLWPDRLCWYYWLFAVGIALPFLFSGQPSYNLVIAAFLVISTALIAPILIYRVCRIPVLDDLRKLPALPKSMQQWFRNQFPDTSRFRRYIPAMVGGLDSSSWLKASSRKSFIKLALAEFHQSNSEAGLGNEWNNRGIVRWGFYWCGPIWSSYLSLWLSLPWISPNYETQSVYAIMLWLVMSACLVLRQTREFQAYTTLDEADRSMLAYPLLPHIGPPRAAEKLTQDTVKKLIYTLQAILVVFFLYALQIVPNSSEPPKPIEIKPCHGSWQCAWDWV